MGDPLVTVLMPVYNGEKYISAAIESVLNQTFSDFEFLIVDDGSLDKTESIISTYKDKRIYTTRQQNSGIAKALNYGLSLSSGKYIARFDADDICFPNRLQAQVDFLKSHPDYIVTGSDAEYVLENGEHLFDFKCVGHTHKEILEALPYQCPFIHSTIMYQKSAVISAGGYNINAHNFEDHLLWIQLKNKGKFANINRPLMKVRFNPASITIDEKWRGAEFKKIKRRAIERGHLSHREGERLKEIITIQENRNYKEGSYYALCGKKFLTNNYQPAKARQQVTKAIKSYPFRLDNYALLIASFFPRWVIHWLHQKTQTKL